MNRNQNDKRKTLRIKRLFEGSASLQFAELVSTLLVTSSEANPATRLARRSKIFHIKKEKIIYYLS